MKVENHEPALRGLKSRGNWEQNRMRKLVSSTPSTRECPRTLIEPRNRISWRKSWLHNLAPLKQATL
jgi:hypothetical protein